MIMQTVLGRHAGLVPIGRRFPVIMTPPPQVTGLYLVDSLLALDFAAFSIALNHILVPALVLSFGALASITRITRASMIEILERDFVRSARAIGIPERVVIGKYVLRNAFIATLTVISLNFGWLMAGAILIETIFDWPGIGLYAVHASLSLDFQPYHGHHHRVRRPVQPRQHPDRRGLWHPGPADPLWLRFPASHYSNCSRKPVPRAGETCGAASIASVPIPCP